MASKTIRRILLENICALIGEPDAAIDEIQRRTKVGRGTAQRLKGEDVSLGVDLLAKAAESLGVEPWQLLVEGLDPENLPRLESPDGVRWPYRNIDLDAIGGLVGTQAMAVEQAMLIALTAAGVSPRKRDGTHG